MALDIFHIPKPQNGYREIFYYTGQTQYWEVPRSVQYLRIMCIGGGGGGAGGSSATNNGGAGGSSGSIIFSLVPAYAVPDILAIYVGAGGKGSTPGNTGGVGQNTSVQGSQGTFLPNVCFAYGGNTASQPGLGTSGGTTTSVTLTSVPLANQYYWFGFNGQAGGSSGTGTGSSVAFPTSGALLTGGAGGGGRGTGTTYNLGGAILVPASQDSKYTIFNQVNSSVNGVEMFYPLLLSTGGGGGNATSSVGGNGGNGGFGSGGGGGGSAPLGGGNGGDGGNGLVIIEAW